MRSFFIILSFVSCLSLAAEDSLDASTVKITIEKDIYQYAVKLLNGKTVDNITQFTHSHCQRDVIDFILVQRAIKLGGLNIKFSFELGNYDARNIKLIDAGLLLVGFDTIWHEEAKLVANNVYISDPIVRHGEYFAGVFTASKNVEFMSTKIQTDLSQVSIVSSQYWHADWKTINALSPKHLVDESDWIVMAKMVSRGWVDVMLVPFTNSQPFEYSGHGYSIAAIPNIKVALQDSRHFVVSKKHPLGLVTYNALQVGIKQLRTSGFIEDAYRQCGFLNSNVDSWKTLQPSNQ